MEIELADMDNKRLIQTLTICTEDHCGHTVNRLEDGETERGYEATYISWLTKPL